MTARAALLPDGKRLHLQHGPIDLIISAEGPEAARTKAFAAACARFDTVLTDLVGELPVLRQEITAQSHAFKGAIARKMQAATQPFWHKHITPMAAVAGSVADEILDAMKKATPLRRAYVNNGGDIALYLSDEARFITAISHVDGRDLGRITLSGRDGIGGIASSGRHGRSLSLGIADSVTVLASNAAKADAAATMIANAVDLPGHPGIARSPACDLAPDSDLGARLVVTGCKTLPPGDIATALEAGLARARSYQSRGLIRAASLTLQGETRLLGTEFTSPERSLTDA